MSLYPYYSTRFVRGSSVDPNDVDFRTPRKFRYERSYTAQPEYRSYETNPVVTRALSQAREIIDRPISSYYHEYRDPWRDDYLLSRDLYSARYPRSSPYVSTYPGRRFGSYYPYLSYTSPSRSWDYYPRTSYYTDYVYNRPYYFSSLYNYY